MSSLSDYLETALLNHVFRNIAYTAPATVYLALFTTMPVDDGTGGVEVTGGSYARKAVAFAAGPAGAGQVLNSAQITFTNMPQVSVVGAGIYDALTAGNLLVLSPLTSVYTTISGENLVVDTNQLTVMLG